MAHLREGFQFSTLGNITNAAVEASDENGFTVPAVDEDRARAWTSINDIHDVRGIRELVVAGLSAANAGADCAIREGRSRVILSTTPLLDEQGGPNHDLPNRLGVNTLPGRLVSQGAVLLSTAAALTDTYPYFDVDFGFENIGDGVRSYDESTLVLGPEVSYVSRADLGAKKLRVEGSIVDQLSTRNSGYADGRRGMLVSDLIRTRATGTRAGHPFEAFGSVVFDVGDPNRVSVQVRALNMQNGYPTHEVPPPFARLANMARTMRGAASLS